LRSYLQYTKDKTTKQLKSTLEKARSDELAKKASLELERAKERKLERQIAACEIKAPRDGTLVYAPARTQPVLRRDGTTALVDLQIEEGAQVRERQLLFTIIPTPEATPD
jgi:HlyD family secretion protein